MKKYLRNFTTIMLCLVIIFTMSACGKTKSSTTTEPATTEAPAASSETTTAPEAPTAPAVKRALSIGTGSSSGAWYIIGGGIANAVNLNSDWFSMTSEAASGGGENLRNLQEGNIDLCMLNSDMGYYFYSSTDSYQGAGDENLRSLIAMPSSAMHIVVKAGLGIESIQDLKGKSIAVGTAGSGYESFANKVITSADMTYDDMDVRMINPSQMADAMKDNQVDAFFYPVQAPGSAITELSLGTDIEILNLSSEFIDKFLSEYIGYVKYTIPADVYNGQSTTVETLATGQFVATLRDAMTEEEVYQLLSDIFDNRSEWLTAHISCNQITETNIDSFIVPLHAGAVKFYTERGVTIPENLTPPEAK